MKRGNTVDEGRHEGRPGCGGALGGEHSIGWFLQIKIAGVRNASAIVLACHLARTAVMPVRLRM